MNYFWQLTPKQFVKHVRIYNEKEKQRVREQDKLNHVLAYYISFAVNEPKKFPKNPITEEEIEEVNKVMTDDEMERQARLNTIKKGGVMNDNGRVTSADNG